MGECCAKDDRNIYEVINEVRNNMKILYLSARQPYPCVKGDQVVAYEQIKRLSQGNKIILITFYKDKKNELFEEMAKYCSQVILIKDNPFKKLLSMIKTISDLKPLEVNMFYRKWIQKLIDRLIIDEEIDQLHVNTFRMARYGMENSFSNKSIDLIDACAFNMKIRRNRASKWIKWLWGFEYHLLNKFEKQIVEKYPIVTVVAERDRVVLGNESVIVNNLGVFESGDISSDRLLNAESFNIVFQGNLSYYANVEAIEHLIDKIYLTLKEKFNNINLYIIGAKPSFKIKKKLREDIILIRDVKLMAPYLSQADLTIYPIFSATGTQLKVLESMALGIPTIVSEEVAKGLDDESAKYVYIAHDEQEFICLAENVINEMHDKKKTVDAMKHIQNKYSWDNHVKKLEKLWEDNQ